MTEPRHDKASRELFKWQKANHKTIPCDCDPRKGRCCTASGWMRCPERARACHEKLKELMAQYGDAK